MKEYSSLTSQLKFVLWPPPFGIRSYLRAAGDRLDFWRSYQRYCRMAPPDAQPQIRDFYPCLHDNTSETPIDFSYYYQDAWAFERIVDAKPIEHVDIGSHHKFVSLLSKVVPTTMVDLRPLPVTLSSLRFVAGSILALPFADASVASVSSLCVVEHIGLGRYGDPFDPDGSVKALQELKRVVRPGGDLYVSVPVDDVNRIYFNAHRAFSEEYLLSLFAPFEVRERRYIYGPEFGERLKHGFGTGCYHLRSPC
jgi:SAM-dependent methyltransferase